MKSDLESCYKASGLYRQMIRKFRKFLKSIFSLNYDVCSKFHAINGNKREVKLNATWDNLIDEFRNVVSNLREKWRNEILFSFLKLRR